jgi:hypothetical protein
MRADEVIFSNFGQNQSYQGSSWFDTGNSSSGNEVNAFAFSPTATATVTGAALPLTLVAGTAATPLTVYIESNSSLNTPGTILATLTSTGSYSHYPATPDVVDFTCSGSCGTLDAGSTYWIVDQATDPTNTTGWLWSYDTDGTWYYNGLGSATGPWTAATNFANDIGAFDVTGTPSTVPPVPEPSSLALLGSGLFGILAAARRKVCKK